MYMYILLVWMTLKRELGLMPILRYGARVILLRGSHERFGQSRRVCVSKGGEEGGGVTVFVRRHGVKHRLSS